MTVLLRKLYKKKLMSFLTKTKDSKEIFGDILRVNLDIAKMEGY